MDGNADLSAVHRVGKAVVTVRDVNAAQVDAEFRTEPFKHFLHAFGATTQHQTGGVVRYLTGQSVDWPHGGYGDRALQCTGQLGCAVRDDLPRFGHRVSLAVLRTLGQQILVCGRIAQRGIRQPTDVVPRSLRTLIGSGAKGQRGPNVGGQPRHGRGGDLNEIQEVAIQRRVRTKVPRVGLEQIARDHALLHGGLGFGRQ